MQPTMATAAAPALHMPVRAQTDPVAVILAVNAVRRGTRMSLRSAAVTFGIPRSTLREIVAVQRDGSVVASAPAATAPAVPPPPADSDESVSVLCSIDVHSVVDLHIVSEQRCMLASSGRISCEPVLLPRLRGRQTRLTRIEEHALAEYMLQRGDMALPLTPAAAGVFFF